MYGQGKDRVLEAMRFTAKERGKGLTAYTIARVCGLTPQHTNRLLCALWHEGSVGFQQEPYRRSFRRMWATTSRCKKMIKEGQEWHVNPHAMRQMELPL